MNASQPQSESNRQKELEKQILKRLEHYGCPDSYLDNEKEWWLTLIAKHSAQRAKDELRRIQREVFKAEIAGTVKWEIEDRLEQLEKKR